MKKSDVKIFTLFIKQIGSYLFNRTLSNTNIPDSEIIFNQWLAGLIDGDGYFRARKGLQTGHLEIPSQLSNAHIFDLLLQRFGGIVKPLTGRPNVVVYYLRDQIGLINLINAINGEIRNPIRFEQFSNLCKIYGIIPLEASPLTYYNGWLSGFFDADGSIYYNLKSAQLFITTSNNVRLLLDNIQILYGGFIYQTKPNSSSFKWFLSNKADIANFIGYFDVCPPRTSKINRVLLIPTYYELRQLKAHLAPVDSVLGKKWTNFSTHWTNFTKPDSF